MCIRDRFRSSIITVSSTHLNLLFYLFYIVERLFTAGNWALYTLVVEIFCLWFKPGINSLLEIVVPMDSLSTEEEFQMLEKVLGCSADDQIVPIRRLWVHCSFVCVWALSWIDTMARISIQCWLFWMEFCKLSAMDIRVDCGNLCQEVYKQYSFSMRMWLKMSSPCCLNRARKANAVSHRFIFCCSMSILETSMHKIFNSLVLQTLDEEKVNINFVEFLGRATLYLYLSTE